MAWPFSSGSQPAFISLSQSTNTPSTQATIISQTQTQRQWEIRNDPKASAFAVPTARWERYPDPIAWSSSRDMVILLEDKFLFCVDIGRLEQYSVAIREIFGIPQSIHGEGTEANPVRIPDILAEDFVLFLRWFNVVPGIDIAPLVNEKLLIAVIKVSNPWMISSGKRWAIHQLNMLTPPLSPSRRLRLSRELNITIWVHDAVADIMKRAAGSKRVRLITDEEINNMGTKAYSIIVKALEALQAEYLLSKKMWHQLMCFLNNRSISKIPNS